MSCVHLNRFIILKDFVFKLACKLKVEIMADLYVDVHIVMCISRHTVVCRAAQVAGAPHREYIYRKKVNAIFTPL